MLKGKKCSIVAVGLMAMVVAVAANNAMKANANKYSNVDVNKQNVEQQVTGELAPTSDTTLDTQPQTTPEVDKVSCKHKNRKEVVLRQAQCARIGIKEIRCADCDKYIRKGIIPKLRHKFGEDGQCEKCGEYNKAKLWGKYEVNGAIYKVTNPLSNGWGNVTYVEPTDKSIASLYIPKEVKIYGRKYQVTKIGDKAFVGCNNLSKVAMASKVKTIGKSAFENCTKLSTVSIGNGVKNIEKGAFKNCSSLKSIKVSKKVEVVGDEAFANCIKLKKVTIGNSIKKISKFAFYNCIALKKVEIGKALQVIEESAFSNCINLKEIEIESIKLKKIGKNAFEGISSEAVITLDKEKVETLKVLFNSETGIKDTVKFEGKKSLLDYLNRDNNDNQEEDNTQQF